MPQVIKIASIETKEGDNTRGHWVSYIITGEDKTKVSTFDTSASSLKEGDTIEAEIELKGKYTNLKTFKVIEHGSPTARPEIKPEPLKPDSGKGDNARGESIEKQVSLKCACETIPQATATDILIRADLFFKWLRGEPSPTVTIKHIPVEKPQEVAEQSGKAVESKVGSSDLTIGFVNLVWLKESLTTLQGKGLKAYSDTNMMSYLNAINKDKSKSISEACAKLNKEQATAFEAKIKDALEMA